VSALPTLHPGQAQVGMVISWQKWSCSSATSWQPQLSRVTAIVVRVDEDTAALDVCLAKRDRYLDGNEKHYDERTGERIYNKFEAPDFDDEDDDGVDEGYRSVLWVCSGPTFSLLLRQYERATLRSRAQFNSLVNLSKCPICIDSIILTPGDLG